MKKKTPWNRILSLILLASMLLLYPAAQPQAASAAAGSVKGESESISLTEDSSPAGTSENKSKGQNQPESSGKGSPDMSQPDSSGQKSDDMNQSDPSDQKSDDMSQANSSGKKSEAVYQPDSSGETLSGAASSDSSEKVPQDETVSASSVTPVEIKESETTGYEQYIRDHANPYYAGSENPVPADFLTNTIITVNSSSHIKSVDELWTDEDGDGYSDHWEALSGMDYGEAILYDMGGNYFVARIDTLGNNAAETVDFHAGRNDTSGTVYPDILYSRDSGLVYVPRKYLQEKNGNKILNSIKTELLYTVPDQHQETSVSLEIKGSDESGTADFDLLDDVVSVKLSAGNSKIKQIEIDGVPYTETDQIADYKNGTLTVHVSPMTTDHIEISMKKPSLLERTFPWLFPENVHAESASPGTLNGHLVFDGIPSVGDSWITKGTNTYVEGGHAVSEGYINPVFLKTGMDEEFEAMINYIANNSGSIDTSEGYAIYKYSSSKACGMTGVERCAVSSKGYVTAKSTKNQVSSIYLSQDVKTNLFCAHMKINNQGSVESDDCGQWWKILKVDENHDNRWGTVTVGIANPTEQTQAGVGIFKMTWMISARIRIQKISSNDNEPLAGAVYEVWTGSTGGTKVAALTTGKDGYSDYSVIENTSFFSASRPGTDDAQHGFYLRETTAPPGYLKNTDQSYIELRIGEKRTITYSQNGNNQKTTVLMDTPEDRTPEISTQAYDAETKEQIVSVSNAADLKYYANLKDTVSLSNLMPGTEYTLTSVIVRKTDSKEITEKQTQIITPKTDTAEITISFGSIEITDLQGEDIVAFETLTYQNSSGEEKTVSHEDPDDKNQTLHIPKIGTSASAEGKKETMARAGKISITDIVSYKNLIPGIRYTVSGKVMDRRTGKEIGVSAEKEFTPDTADGEISLDFSIDADAGDYVVFEKLYLNDVEITGHEDLDDEGQTVTLQRTVPTGVRLPDYTIAVLLLIAGSAACLILLRRKP